ncbi:MAG: hypothetical protein GX547_16420 [Phycisphaerae bacterium]|nr:hypothetical protein [Phycisphaerae bacterium]
MSTPKTTKKRTGGRPKGARTEPRPTVAVALSRCTACGSTRRTPYTQTRRTPYAGRTPDGQPYTAVVRRWTRCEDCGQARVDLSYEHTPEEKPSN